MHPASCLLLAALLLAAAGSTAGAGAAPAAPDGSLTNDLATAGLGINVCEAYTSREECLEHPDTCIPCSAWGKVDVCFETAIAKRLPTKLFTCDWPAPPIPPAPAPQPSGPDTDCNGLSDESSCSATPTCVWCVSAAVPSACYSEAEAKRLPAAVFRCKFPSSLA